MKYLYYTGVLLLTVLFGSCNDFLEVPTKNFISDDVLWSKPTNADLYLNDIYNQIPEMQDDTEHLDQYTDNSDVGVLWMKGYNNIGTAQVTPNNMPNGTRDIWKWDKAYTNIRKCNIFIKNVSESSLPDDYKEKRIAEVRFLRAFFYHYIWLAYGGVPIITVPLNNQEAGAVIEYPRKTSEETFKFIADELNDIYLTLPETYSGKDLGRITQGAALTLKGWCELYHASPLRNTANDMERWKTASKTNRMVMELDIYDLAANFNELFMTNNNIESIFARQYGPDKGFSLGRFAPVKIGSISAGWGNFQPTQDLVDDFSMDNGKTIAEAGAYYDPQNPYIKREKRFYETIIYDNSTWHGSVITTRVGGNNPIDRGYTGDFTHTGYYGRKRLDESKDPSTYFDGKCYQNYMFFRYAEVLLSFAEAENEVNGPTTEVLSAVNKVRTRNNNLPTVEATYGTVSKDKMREIILRERRVELSFEDKRWWDVLRWKIADKLPDGSPGVLNKSQRSMVITEEANGKLKYTIEETRKRTFLPKMYLMPVPQDALDRNSEISKQNGGIDNWIKGQNPGY